MGKKSRKKFKYRYTKSEFKDIVCAHCGLCPKNTDPAFCFDEVYKKSPKLFMNTIYGKLVQHRWPIPSDFDEVDDRVENFFKKTFCDSNICEYNKYNDGVCKQLEACVTKFNAQLQSGSAISLSKPTKTKKKKGKKKPRYVVAPYPTFFCSDGFETKVREILNGNDNKKQITSKKLSRTNTGDVGKQTENTKP